MQTRKHTIDYELLSNLLNNTLTKQADFNFSALADDLFSDSPNINIAPINNINPLNRNKQEKSVQEENAEEELSAEDIDKLGTQQQDEQEDFSQEILPSYLARADQELAKYKFTPKLKSLLRIVMALRWQYPQIVHSKDSVVKYILDYLSLWSKKHNIFIDPNDDTPRNINILKALKNGTIRSRLSKNNYFPDDQSLADQIFEILEAEVEDDPSFKELMQKLIQEQNFINAHQTDEQVKQSINTQENRDIQDEFDSYQADLADQELNEDTTSALSDNDIKLLSTENSQLSMSQKLKKQRLEKQLKYVDFRKHPELFSTNQIEAPVIARLAIDARTYAQAQIKYIFKKLRKIIGQHNNYVITDSELEQLKRVRAQLQELFKQTTQVLTFDKYNDIAIKALNLYEHNNRLRFMTKAQFNKQQQLQQMEDSGLTVQQRSRRNTHFVNFEDDDRRKLNQNVSTPITANRYYKYIENLMVYDYTNKNSNKYNFECGGIFERNNYWLEEYTKYIKGDKASKEFNADIFELATHLLTEICYLLNDDTTLIKHLPNVTSQELADELKDWYTKHIILDYNKYFHMLELATRKAVEKFYHEYGLDPEYAGDNDKEEDIW